MLGRVKSKWWLNLCFLLLFVLFIILCYSCLLRNNKPTPIHYKLDIKFILIWTISHDSPLHYMGNGQSKFLKLKCPVRNCYVTSSKDDMENVQDFHAILFHGPDLSSENIALPTNRSPNQKYVFVSMESSHYYPIHDKIYDGFFNWTWTYKLNSDLYYGYIIIRNEHGQVIGPNKNTHWLKNEEMKDINDDLKADLSSKNKVAAWFVSNCHTRSEREVYVSLMISELALHNMTVDTYGACGSKQCSSSLCNELLKKDYYFYLSFENSFSEDYVTEKLLTALQNNAIPVVFGAANYTRFMPDNAYLNAAKLSVEELVGKMINIMADNDKYYEFFKWRNHYSYHRVEDSVETNFYCNFCSKINEEANETGFYEEFRKWWNPTQFPVINY